MLTKSRYGHMSMKDKEPHNSSKQLLLLKNPEKSGTTSSRGLGKSGTTANGANFTFNSRKSDTIFGTVNFLFPPIVNYSPGVNLTLPER